MPDLTAHDLYELVKGLPEEARPEGLVYHEVVSRWCVESKWSLDPLADAHAILLHEASVMRWLVDEAVVGRGLADRIIVSVVPSGEWLVSNFTGPTFLHALVAAAMSITPHPTK